MNTALLRWVSSHRFWALTLLIVATAISTHADQIEMQNGDRYTGAVLSMDTNIIILKSDVLGTVRLRREEVKSMSVGSANATAVATSKAPKPPSISSLVPRPAVAPAAINATQSSLPRQIATSPELISKVQSELLAGAGPKATQKFDSLVAGLSTGNLNIADIRKEAASVAAQLRELKGSSDDESAAIFDEYLAVLDNFLQETKNTPAPAKPIIKNTTATKAQKPVAPANPAKPATPSLIDDE